MMNGSVNDGRVSQPQPRYHWKEPEDRKLVVAYIAACKPFGMRMVQADTERRPTGFWDEFRVRILPEWVLGECPSTNALSNRFTILEKNGAAMRIMDEITRPAQPQLPILEDHEYGDDGGIAMSESTARNLITALNAQTDAFMHSAAVMLRLANKITHMAKE